jgi:hypothetical protein
MTDPDIVKDAMRWRALMSSQRIRVMGGAGYKWTPDGEPLMSEGTHIGVEFWSKHEAAHPSTEYPQDRCRKILTAYADSLIK